MQTYIWDDGSSITQDAFMNVVSVTDSTGATYAPNRNIGDQFANVILGGVSAAINRALAPKPVTVQQAVPQASVFASPLFGLALLGVGLFAVYKLASE